MIEMTLTIVQARKLAKALNGTANSTLADVHDYLTRYINEHDSIVADKAPWRKVVGKHTSGVYWFDQLECGHKYMLRQSSRAGCGWIEDHAKKRRCPQCAP